MKKNIISLCLLVPILCLGGCTYITHYKQLMFLKGFEDNQREIKAYLDTQEKLFYKLKDDLLNNRLVKGRPKKKILSVYGEPVFCRRLNGADKIKEICFYRHPVFSFSSDMICLDFDLNQHLDSWRLIKGSNVQ